MLRGFPGQGAIRSRPVTALGVFVLLSALSAVHVDGTAGQESPEPDRGRLLYESNCLRCHGADGEDMDYYGIVPLAGIGRRPPVGLVGRFRQASFFAWGSMYEGDKAQALASYLFRLKGRKGFLDPGWLWSPELLNRKAASLHECRIVDVRSAESYKRGHIPNAVHFPLPEIRSGHLLPLKEVQERLVDLAVSPLTQIVLYDETLSPKSAWLWWSLVQAGHQYASILDGGWRLWSARGLPTSTRVPKLGASDAQQASAQPEPGLETTIKYLQGTRRLELDWKETLTEQGLKNHSEVRQYLSERGWALPGKYQIGATTEEGCFWVFLCHLLGADEIRFDPTSRTMIAGPSNLR